MSDSEEPRTTAGRWLLDHQGLVNIGRWDGSMRGDEIDLHDAILAIEAEARAAVERDRDDLLEALEWAMAPNPRHEGRHRLDPRCSTFMPTDSTCDCGYTKARVVLISQAGKDNVW